MLKSKILQACIASIVFAFGMCNVNRDKNYMAEGNYKWAAILMPINQLCITL